MVALRKNRQAHYNSSEKFLPRKREAQTGDRGIVGELDQAIPPSDAKLMADQIPNARLAIITNAAHLANLEQPEAFSHIVAAFASSLSKGK
jgi:pimeloyl-ACP methyl ester carboxylesterase